MQGNVRTDDLVRVWNDRFRPHRDRRWLAGGACDRCDEFARCQGNSLHLYDEALGGPVTCTRELLRRKYVRGRASR